MLKITEFEKRPNRDSRRSKTRIYVWAEKESVLENLANRRSRPHQLYKKHVMAEILERANLPVVTKVRWSQTAGCSCGCSPGFIVDGSYGWNIFVTVGSDTNPDEARIDPKLADVAEARQLELGLRAPDFTMALAIEKGQI